MLTVRAFTKAFLKSAWIDSAVKGIRAAGDDCQYADDLNTSCDLAMHTSGVKAIRGQIIDARRFLIKKYGWRRLIVESRCFRHNSRGGKEKYWRLSLGGFLDDEAIYHPPGFQADASRWEMIQREQEIELKPWRSCGSHVLLCGQKPSDASLRGQNVDAWFRATTAKLRQHTDREIVLRTHPLDRGGQLRIQGLRGRGVMISAKERIADDLQDAWAMVTFTSLSVIESACAGIPVFAMDSGNLAWKVANRDIASIEKPQIFDREPWLWDLAYRQWKISELESGFPWTRLREAYYAHN